MTALVGMAGEAGKIRLVSGSAADNYAMLVAPCCTCRPAADLLPQKLNILHLRDIGVKRTNYVC